MKKLSFLVLSIVMSLLSNAAITQANMSPSTNGSYVFTCYGEDGQISLQLSLYPDFSRATTAKMIQASDNRLRHTMTLKPSHLTSGRYYWRVINFATGSYAPQKDKWTYFDFTGTAKENIPDLTLKDETAHETFKPDTDTDINITSLWLRSFNLGNNIFKSIDHPNSNNAQINETYNHGAVVRNGIIYINRGSLSTSGWVLDKTRVWLERYDLKTGKEHKLLLVRAPGGGDYPAKEVMPWIREDADGTIYFTTSRLNNGAPRRVTIYTIDLDGITADTDEVTAREIKTLTMPEGFDQGGFFTVDGSIASGEYTLWSIPENFYVDTKATGFTVHRWNIKGSSVKHAKASMPDIKWLTPDLNDFNGFGLARVYPVDDEYFYMHTGRTAPAGPTMSVMLCRFIDGGECEVISSFDDSGDAVPPTAHGSAGISMFEISGNRFIAYGVAKEKDNTVMQIMATPSYTSNFREHRTVWRLCDDKGMSTNAFQGCDVKYLPGSTDGKGGMLLLYAPNAALGLYNVDVDSRSTGIEATQADTAVIRYCAGSIIADREIDGFTMYDLGGHAVASRTGRGTHFDISDMAPGIYIIRTNGSLTSVTIIVTR